MKGARAHIVAVSPHLDDAVFSIGARLTTVAAGGADVRIVTVFAGDPESNRPPGWWDTEAGFRTEGDAAQVRRTEDALACAQLGATPVWLPFADGQYRADRSGVIDALAPQLADADLIFVPGFPLVHPDHAWTHDAIVAHAAELPPIALFAEQPYAEAEWVRARRRPREPEWKTVRPDAGAWLRKQRATRAYRSQLRAMARPWLRVPVRIALYELRFGGETLTAPDGRAAAAS